MISEHYLLFLFYSDVRTETNQTLFVARLAGVAHVHPQGLLPQCTVGYLHAKHLVELHGVSRWRAACSEEAASGLHAGKHRHAYIPAGGKGKGHAMMSRCKLQTVH